MGRQMWVLTLEGRPWTPSSGPGGGWPLSSSPLPEHDMKSNGIIPGLTQILGCLLPQSMCSPRNHSFSRPQRGILLPASQRGHLFESYSYSTVKMCIYSWGTYPSCPLSSHLLYTFHPPPLVQRWGKGKRFNEFVSRKEVVKKRRSRNILLF